MSELQSYKGDVTIPVYGTIADADVYLKKEADAVITELKDKCQMHDFFWEGCGFAKRGFKNTIAVSEAFDRLEAENAELKQKLDEKEPWVKMLGEGEAALSLELEKTKQKLENVQASMYADMVDANMENRRLKRALWIARARSAHNAAMMWEILSDEYLNGAQFTIDFRCVGDPDVTEFQMFRGCMDWMKIYENVERKCRAEAEEYK